MSSTLGTCPVLGRPIGQDPLVSRFMRGVLRQRPPKNKLFPTWDVTSVLNHLKSWGETKSLPLKKLLMKTAFLLALVCYKRPADLCNMQIQPGYWQLSMRGFSCQPLGFGKTEIHNPTPPIIVEPFLEDPQLCPVYHMVRLEKRLCKLRSGTVKQFWISAKKPYNAVTPHTMSRWLKRVIMGSGALAGAARDVRSAGASTAVQASLDMARILKAADWQRLSTLKRHYFKPQRLESLSSILRVA